MLTEKLVVCKSCFNSKGNSVLPSRKKIYQYLHEVQCAKCNTHWLVCAFHDKRFAYRSFFLAKRHLQEIDHYQCVSTTSDVNKINTIDTVHIDQTGVNDMYFTSDDNENNMELINSESNNLNTNDFAINSFLSCFNKIELNYYNDVMRRYIESESKSTGYGLRRIVACAFAMNVNAEFNNLSYNETMYHTLATSFCCTLTASQLSQYYQLSHMIETTFNPTYHGASGTLHTRPLSSAIDIDRYYLNRSTSITNNIPIPTVEENNGHAYISIKEAVQHFLCFETKIDGMLKDNICTEYKNIISHKSPIVQSEIAIEIRNKVKYNLRNETVSPLIIYIIVWSDDFEPNHVKQFKKSSWIKTITLAPPQGYQTSPRYTYIIALSPKKSNHELINHHFNQELQDLKTPTYMYCKATNCNIPVVVETLAQSADRPERSALNCILSHNGLTTRRWRFAAYLSKTSLKSCQHCKEQRIHLLCANRSYCNNDKSCCNDWNYSHSNIGVPPPKDYPKKQHPNSPPPPLGREVENIKLLYPIELSYDILKQAVKFSLFNCFYDTWTKAEVMVYLKSIGLNEKYSNDNVYKLAQQLKSVKDIDDSSVFDYIIYPIAWKSGINLDQCIDTPMHQIFQGIVKSIMDETMNWLKHKLNPSYREFGEYVNGTLSAIHDINLDWCRMEQFTGGRMFSLGGWQAEQYVAFARCSLLVYAVIRDVVGDDEVGLDEHECMIQSMLCFISRVMGHSNTDTEIILEYIKCFLSACDDFENTAFRLNGQDPFWYKKGNFLSLLNLPLQMKKFGALRHYWEGSRERSIQSIKPYLIKMRSTSSYYKAKMRHMYIAQTIKMINQDITEAQPLTENHYQERPVYERFLSFRVYSTNYNITESIQNNQILSTVIIKDSQDTEKHYLVQKMPASNLCILSEIAFNDEDGFNKCGLWYAPLKVHSQIENKKYSQDDINDMSIDYALVCPCISTHSSLNSCYTAITKEWKYRTNIGKHTRPLLSKQFFLSTILK